MSTKRYGPADENGVKAVEVNLDAFKDVKSSDDLKKEPGRIFGHLAQEQESAAYDELAADLGLAKSTPSGTAKLTPPAQPGQ